MEEMTLIDIPRKNDSHLFAVQYSDDDFIRALERCLNNATVVSSEVAKELGCNSRYATARLKALADQGRIEGVVKGNRWGFRLK
jgi:hypothetical protein